MLKRLKFHFNDVQLWNVQLTVVEPNICSITLVDYHTSVRVIMDLGHSGGLLGRQRAVDRQVEAQGHLRRPEGCPKSIILRAEV